jgi:lipopolysaccharide export system permease protein
VVRLFAYVFPSFLEVTIPMAILLGVVVAFARFSSDGELLAMRAAGVSLWQLARPALAMGTIAGAATLVMAQWASPWAQRRITETTYEIAKTRATAALRPRMFNALATDWWYTPTASRARRSGWRASSCPTSATKAGG